MKNINLSSLWLFLLLSIAGYSQAIAIPTHATDSLITSINAHLSGYPSEMVYLQTSKDIYETGEDLWFKAYGLDAQSFGLSGRSKTLYLQMVNKKDSVVWQEKYPIENGIAEGHVYVNEKLADGDYLLEGYTRHSFYNDSIGALPARKIRIVKNINRSNIQTDEKRKGDLRFELFPEGGNLVSGLPCRLAFKATDAKGYPTDIEGVLFQDGHPVTTFHSTHDGMGFFFLTPDFRKEYRIELKDGRIYPLPKIYPQGMTFRLAKQGVQYLEFIVSQTKGLAVQEFYLLGHIRGMVCCVAKGNLKDDLKIKIPLTEFLYQGIAEFTLFNENMQPMAERLVYVHPEKKLNISIEPEKKNYALREKATLKIRVTDSEDKPIQAHLGISIFDKAYQDQTNPVDILTHCYLSSQIRGKIYNPAYYFDEANKDRAQALELLLLTQGWRRYVWDASHPAGHGKMFLKDDISGIQTLDVKKKAKIMQGTQQLLQVSGAEGNSQFVVSDSTGHFTIDTELMKKLRGSFVYIKPMLSKEFKPNLEVEDYFPLIKSIRVNKPNYHPLTDSRLITQRQVLDMPVVSSDSTILLDEVTVTGKKHRVFRDKFMGKLDSLAQINMNGPYVCTTCKYLINYRTDYNAHHGALGRCPAKGQQQPVNGKSYEIAKFKYYKGGDYFTVEDRQMVLYEGPLYTEEELLHMNNIWRTKGYYAQREFYEPDEIDMQLSTPDARNTLLWNPSVITNEKGEASVSFFCSDINTEFTGIVEGVDGTGLLGKGKCEFRVIRK